MTAVDWLLDSDPSIRWQVMRDLTDASAEAVAAERARIATEGAGARLLALQAADGRWGGAAWNWAIELVGSKRDGDGPWPLEACHPGRVLVETDDGEGRPSRWNTLRALRVLRWYEQDRS